jgi:hypothetical protein
MGLATFRASQMPAPFEIVDVDVDPQSWTPLVAPFGCNNVAIKNTLSCEAKIHLTNQKLAKLGWRDGRSS